MHLNLEHILQGCPLIHLKIQDLEHILQGCPTIHLEVQDPEHIPQNCMRVCVRACVRACVCVCMLNPAMCKLSTSVYILSPANNISHQIYWLSYFVAKTRACFKTIFFFKVEEEAKKSVWHDTRYQRPLGGFFFPLVTFRMLQL